MKKILSMILIMILCVLMLGNICLAAPKAKNNSATKSRVEKNKEDKSSKKSSKKKVTRNIISKDSGKKKDNKDDDTSAVNTDYFWEYSDTDLMDEKAWKSLEELIEESYPKMPAGKSIAQMVINEIYARHGYEFSTKEIGDYFKEKSWYEPKTNDMNKIGKELNSIELKNVKFLQSVK